MKIKAVVLNALLLLACESHGAPGLHEELRKASAVSGLALVESRGAKTVVIPFDGEERFFQTGLSQPLVFSKSGHAVLWWNQAGLSSELLVKTVGGTPILQSRPPVGQLMPSALNETAARLAFVARSTNAVRLTLQWASFDFSRSGVVGEADGPSDWSPDGEALVYERAGQIYIFDVSRGSSVPLVRGHEPTWRPDGAAVAYLTEGSQAALVTREGSSIKWPLDGYHPIHGLHWSPDGRYVVFPEEVPEHIPLIGTYYRLVVCRVSDGGAITVRKFGAGAGDTGNFHWIANYRDFCTDCKSGEPFN
jgi:hypothetical protein